MSPINTNTSVVSEVGHNWGRLVTGLPSSSSTAVEMVSYYSTSSQSIDFETDTAVNWDGVHASASYTEVITNLFRDEDNKTFINVSDAPMILSISGFIGWSVDEEAPTSSRNVFLVKNGDVVGDLGRHSHAVAAAGTNVPTSPITSILYLEPNDYFRVYVWHNSPSGPQALNALSDFPGSRLTILRLV